MKLEILQIPDCPNVPVLERRIQQAAQELSMPVEFTHRVIDDPAEAAAAGMTGSPTLLIDGRDPFPARDRSGSLSCRLHPSDDGGFEGAPSVAALHAVLGSLATPFTAQIIDTLFADDTPTSTTLLRTAIRLLALGAPITVEQLAAAAGVDPTELAAAPAAADIEYDENHRITGWGLTLNETPHRLTVDGRLLYAWCAADTLLFPAILDRSAAVESPCAATGTTIRLTVHPETGVTDLHPAAAVISLPGPDELDRTKVRTTTCNPGRYFADASAATTWQAQHPTGLVLTVADAYRQLQPIAERVLTATSTPDGR
ncbi:organomercurial lyase MerB [Nocardia brasiliensis]|uniref:organomercurial lyase MerB n=1 Tax=Nocardia brasiliensis TaxID=37326 RepID=UPI003670076D